MYHSWERGFVETVSAYYEKKKDMSPLQVWNSEKRTVTLAFFTDFVRYLR